MHIPLYHNHNHSIKTRYLLHDNFSIAFITVATFQSLWQTQSDSKPLSYTTIATTILIFLFPSSKLCIDFSPLVTEENNS